MSCRLPPLFSFCHRHTFVYFVSQNTCSSHFLLSIVSCLNQRIFFSSTLCHWINKRAIKFGPTDPFVEWRYGCMLYITSDVVHTISCLILSVDGFEWNLIWFPCSAHTRTHTKGIKMVYMRAHLAIYCNHFYLRPTKQSNIGLELVLRDLIW